MCFTNPLRGGWNQLWRWESWGIGMLSALLPFLLRMLCLCFLLHGFAAFHYFSFSNFPAILLWRVVYIFHNWWFVVLFFSYRDIPMPLVSSGVEHGNLRELAFARMKDLGIQVLVNVTARDTVKKKEISPYVSPRLSLSCIAGTSWVRKLVCVTGVLCSVQKLKWVVTKAAAVSLSSSDFCDLLALYLLSSFSLLTLTELRKVLIWQSLGVLVSSKWNILETF